MSAPVDGGPAFPHYDTGETGTRPGMTLREYAAIKLRVPESGNEWLDTMIRASLRDEFATQAMQGFSANPDKLVVAAALAVRAKLAYEQADAMLAARGAQP